LEDLADAYAQGDEHKKAQKVKALRKKEKTRLMYNHLTLSFKGPRTPLTSLLLPKGATYRLTSDPHEMNSALCEMNKKQLQASASSPFVRCTFDEIG